MAFLITIVVIIVTLIILSKIIEFKDDKAHTFVIKNSKALKELQEINRSISFDLGNKKIQQK